MKKIILLTIIALISVAGGALVFTRNKENLSVKLAGGVPENKITVVATLFPQYDFARRIACNQAEITLLLPPGVESHSYEPSPADIAKIGNARVFLYTGDEMEPWAKRLVSGFEKGKKPLLVDVSQGVTLSPSNEVRFHDEACKKDHDSIRAINDPHIWTDPNNAIAMTKNILTALVAVDPKNRNYYRENASSYLAELVSLDRDIKTAVASAKRREIVIGGRNAMHYFMKRYGITAYAAFDSCSAEQEPSVKTMALLKGIIEKKGFSVIYYEELQQPRLALTLAEGTDAKLLLLHSVHNLSREDFAAGKNYISLMRQNLENLKEGLI